MLEKLLFRKVELWFLLLLLLILIPLSVSWGVAVIEFKVFPYGLYREIADFVRGDPTGMDQSTLLDRVVRETTNPMATWIREYDITLNDQYRAVAVKDLDAGRDSPRLFFAGPQPPYRLLIGAFALKDSFWAGLLLDDQGRVRHTWNLSGGDLKTENGAEGSLYGAAVLPDGSLIYTKQELGKGLIKRDASSKIVWINEGTYHHVVAVDERYEFAWTLGREQHAPFPSLVKIDVETGETLQSISMEDVYRRNAENHIFDVRSRDANMNMPHPNDIEILSTDLAKAFPMFEAGDLAVNYHMSNLVFVLDPTSLEVKFWHTGAGDGAHDVDFQANGLLTIFNNNFRAAWPTHREFRPGFSEIVAISVADKKHWTVASGERAELRTQFNGMHEFRGTDRVVFDSALQGRFTEIDVNTGEITFDFVNVLDEAKGASLHVSQSFSLPRDFFLFLND